MCFVRKGLDYVFSRHELKWLDDIMPESHKREKEEKKRRMLANAVGLFAEVFSCCYCSLAGVVQTSHMGWGAPAFFSPIPSPFLSSSVLPLPSLAPPLEVPPTLIAARGSVERFSSRSGSGKSPAAKRYLVNFRLKISPLVATIFGSFSGNETSDCSTVD